jgi:transglutaminase-like putative cysteine protease
MTGRRRLGLVAASATVLASAPLSAIFDSYTWLMEVILAVGLIATAVVSARTLRFPTWAQALSMVVALLLVLTWMFPSGKELLGLLPTTGTFEHFGSLISAAGNDTRSYGVPVPDLKGLLFVTVLGVGAVAIAVDLLTVVLRRPALAGLPMLAIYSVPVAVYVDSVPVLPFIIGSIGFLWLLVADNVDRVRRFGRRFTGDGRDVDVWEPSPLAAAGRRLAVIGVAAAVLLPLAVPAMTGGLLSQLTQSGVGSGTAGFGTGGTRGLNLFSSLSGALTQGPTVDMVKVTTTERDPFYLRFGVADVVTDNGFGNRTPSGKPLSQGLPDPRRQQATDGATYQQYHATVQVTDSLSTSLAPVYSTPVDTDKLDGTWSYDSTAQVVYSNRQTTKGKKYSFDYVRASYTPNALRDAPSLPADDASMASFTKVPADPTVIKIVNGLVKGQDTDYDKVSAIYRYFSAKNGFSYSLSTKSGTTGSDIANFLTNKVGFCQQYASAMAWMVRQAGIPARVAFGFTRGGSQSGDTYTLTNKNLHAWTEVYFSGFGWVPFDATPAADVVGSTRSGWAPDADVAPPTATASATTAAPGTNASAGAGNADKPGQANTDHDPAALGGSTQTGGSTTPLWIAAIMALLIALLLVPAVRRGLLRRRRHHATVPRAPVVGTAGPAPPGIRTDVTVTVDSVRARVDAHAAWDELIDTMIDYRVPVDPAETPRVTAQRLIHDGELTSAPAESATLLGQAEERARYARQPLQGGELTAALAKVRKGLAQTVDRRVRIMAVLLPPSVTLHWRLAIADASGRWMGTLGDLRERTARFSPRRLLTSRAR